LANGALHAPKRAAAIFQATTGDAVSLADVGAQEHGNDEAKYSQGEAQEPANITSGGKREDHLQKIDCNSNSKEDFKGRRRRILAIGRGLGAKVELHAVQDLTERAGVAPKREAKHGMATSKSATIAQPIAPASRWHIVRATHCRFRDNQRIEALTRHYPSVGNANLVRSVVAGVDKELVAFSQVRRSNDFHSTVLHRFSHGNRFRRDGE
jgi:hypothetical protein